MQATIFGALGEPTRLRIVELLRDGPMSVGEIAEVLEVRQPQVSKHLRVLGDSGIVTGEALARRRIYHLEAQPFEEVGHWVE
ncbi:MAG TPA: metalloregulator ArsR/SmtB family transcription factor, partial [Mycobacterium sp.]|nr:metalloregulator ArsR/SmtB family transcription factor [Mycobacterium sp.]